MLQFIILTPLIGFVSAQGWETLYTLTNDREHTLGTNHVLGDTIPRLGKEWKISFDFKATLFIQGLTNIIWLQSNNTGYTAVILQTTWDYPTLIQSPTALKVYYSDGGQWSKTF